MLHISFIHVPPNAKRMESLDLIDAMPLKYRDAGAERVRDAFLVEQRHQDLFVGPKVDPPPQQDAVAVRRHRRPGALRAKLNDLAFVRSFVNAAAERGSFPSRMSLSLSAVG